MTLPIGLLLIKLIYCRTVSALILLIIRAKSPTYLVLDEMRPGDKLIMMIQKQIEMLLSVFTDEGGFTEALTAERLQHRTKESIEQDAPQCPVCGKPMIRRIAKKGVNSGKEFWSCTGYPDCRGTRKII